VARDRGLASGRDRVLALALIPFSSALSPLAIAWILAGALVVQVVVELAGHERHAEAL